MESIISGLATIIISIVLICAKKIFFVKIICSTHQRKCFSTILGNNWKIQFLKEYRHAPTLQKWWKFVLSQFVLYPNLCLENIFCQSNLFHSSKEVFLHNFRPFLENWIFDGISRGGDLTKMVKIWAILNCAKKIFCQNYLFKSSKEVFLHNLRQYLENWIFDDISTGADLTKMPKIWTILNCAKKIFFVKIICSTHQRKCFSTILGHFWKIEFLTEYQEAGILQKWWKFELS